MDEKKRSKRIWLYLLGTFLCLVVASIVILYIASYSTCSGGASECHINIAKIRTAQESYRFDNGVYLACPPNPAGKITAGSNAAIPIPWDEGVEQWEQIGFKPFSKVRDQYVGYQYEVIVSNDGQSFVITATCDGDEDGVPAVYTVDTEVRSYPKPILSPPGEI